METAPTVTLSDTEEQILSEKRIAMWAVPRSMATALLRSWSNRGDTVVSDEPLMVPYVMLQGKDLGITREQLAESSREKDWRKVVAELTGLLPEGKYIFYQKHQPQNLLTEVMGIKWLHPFTNCFLIRDPKDMLLSLHKLVPAFTFEETGWPDLKKLFDYFHRQQGLLPPVIDARDLQNQPEQTLSLLCDAVGVEFSDEMLRWPALDTNELQDIEKPWYGAVFGSTGFRPYQSKDEPLPAHLIEIHKRCHEIYQELYDLRLH